MYKCYPYTNRFSLLWQASFRNILKGTYVFYITRHHRLTSEEANKYYANILCKHWVVSFTFYSSCKLDLEIAQWHICWQVTDRMHRKMWNNRNDGLFTCWPGTFLELLVYEQLNMKNLNILVYCFYGLILSIIAIWRDIFK